MARVQMRIVHVIPFAARVGGYEGQGRLMAEATAEATRAVAGEVRGRCAVTVVTHADHAGAIASSWARESGIEVAGVRHRRGRFEVRDVEEAVRGADVIHAHAMDPLTGAVIEVGRRRGIAAVVKAATQGDVTRLADRGAAVEDEGNGEGASGAEEMRRGWLAEWRERQRRVIQRRNLDAAWGAIRGCERFVAHNGAMAEEMREQGIARERIVQWPNAVRVPERPVEFRREGGAAIWVGRLERRKSAEVAIEATARVRERHRAATLDVVGDGPMREEWEAKAREVDPRGEAIRWRGEVDDVAGVTAGADLFVFTSRREGCPNVLLEAAAAGLACIATAIPGVVEYFGDGDGGKGGGGAAAVLVPAGDVEALATAWTELLNDPERRREMGERAREVIAKRAGLEVMLPKYLELYEELAGSGREE